MAQPATDHRRAVADRNVEAILDAAERLLEAGTQPSISAVAKEAGLSRVTVYAHFEDLGQLLEALVERAVRRSVTAIEAAEPERGPAPEALLRVIDASWEQLGRHEGIGREAAAELSSHAMRRSHRAAHRLLRQLVDRGQSEKTFRRDVSPDWLVTSFFALVHAARDEVLARRKRRTDALQDLRLTLQDLFVGANNR
jgi:TetR/AcrR family transcriptional regulator, mexCD-oprJ operon repressor